MCELEAKVQRLERSVRRLVIVLASVGVSGVCGLLLGASQPNRTVEASRFVLKNKEGQEVAALGMENEEPTLSMLKRKRGPWPGGKVKLTALALTFSGSVGEPRLILGAGDLSDASIDFLDKEGNTRLRLSTSKDVGSYMSFQDQRGEWHLQLGADDDGTPFLDYVPKGTTEDVQIIPRKPAAP